MLKSTDLLFLFGLFLLAVGYFAEFNTLVVDIKNQFYCGAGFILCSAAVIVKFVREEL